MSNKMPAASRVEANSMVKVTKVEDLVFGGLHPNGVNAGYIKKGFLVTPLEIGAPCSVMGLNGRMLRTSLVTSIDGNEFTTQNSKYIIEHLSNDQQ